MSLPDFYCVAPSFFHPNHESEAYESDQGVPGSSSVMKLPCGREAKLRLVPCADPELLRLRDTRFNHYLERLILAGSGAPTPAERHVLQELGVIIPPHARTAPRQLSEAQIVTFAEDISSQLNPADLQAADMTRVAEERVALLHIADQYRLENGEAGELPRLRRSARRLEFPLPSVSPDDSVSSL